MTETEKWINESLKSLPHLCAEVCRLSEENDILRARLAKETGNPTPNDPLTLEELREMDGEPAYLPGGECWVLVTFNGFAAVFNWPDGSSCSAADWYNKIGPAYRRKPEGERHEN